jgi:hypothetical protein
MNLSEEEKSIIIGSLLGDGHLERNGVHFRLQITHSIKQKSYLLWKMRKLKRLLSGKIYVYKRLYIPGYYVKDFREKIKTYIIPSLRYKLWPRRD